MSKILSRKNAFFAKLFIFAAFLAVAVFLNSPAFKGRGTTLQAANQPTVAINTIEANQQS